MILCDIEEYTHGRSESLDSFELKTAQFHDDDISLPGVGRQVDEWVSDVSPKKNAIRLMQPC